MSDETAVTFTVPYLYQWRLKVSERGVVIFGETVEQAAWSPYSGLFFQNDFVASVAQNVKHVLANRCALLWASEQKP